MACSLNPKPPCAFIPSFCVLPSPSMVPLAKMLYSSPLIYFPFFHSFIYSFIQQTLWNAYHRMTHSLPSGNLQSSSREKDIDIVKQISMCSNRENIKSYPPFKAHLKSYLLWEVFSGLPKSDSFLPILRYSFLYWSCLITAHESQLCKFPPNSVFSDVVMAWNQSW